MYNALAKQILYIGYTYVTLKLKYAQMNWDLIILSACESKSKHIRISVSIPSPSIQLQLTVYKHTLYVKPNLGLITSGTT